MGVSGRAMLEALINGTDSPETIAELARGALRRKRTQLANALDGVVGPSQRLLLARSRHRHQSRTAPVAEPGIRRILPPTASANPHTTKVKPQPPPCGSRRTRPRQRP